MIKTIIFDYMGVFAPESMVGAWIIKNNLPNVEARRVALKKLSLKWDLGEINYSEFNEILSKYTEIPVNKIWATLFEKVLADQELVDFVKILKKKYKIILLSNSPLENTRRMIINQKIDKIFDEIILSAEHQLAKPDPRIYQLALSLSHSQPQESIFIDDRQENINAAQKLGIKSFLFTDTLTLKKELDFLK
jgi:epoxide hydrolase-like predicted phosphatase